MFNNWFRPSSRKADTTQDQASHRQKNLEPSSFRRCQEDITKCSICNSLLADPRTLPCLETFCLKCIEKICLSKKPGDAVQCPSCGEEFDIPENGVKGVPKNLFISKWLQIMSAESGTYSDGNLQCASCEKKTVTSFCETCRENYCDQCAQEHRSQKATHGHTQTQLDGTAVSSRRTAGNCQKHPDSDAQQYCIGCKVAFCILCDNRTHSNHETCSLSEMAQSLKDVLQRDEHFVASGLDWCVERIEGTENAERLLHDGVARVEADICLRADQLKEAIESQKNKLLDDLKSEKRSWDQLINQTRNSLEHRAISLSGLKQAVETLTCKGTPNEIVAETENLHSISDELLAFDDLHSEVDNVNTLSIKFVASKQPTLTDRFLLGKFRFRDEPTLMHEIPADRSAVNCVTLLGTRLYVLRQSLPLVSVYEVNTFHLQGSIFVPESENLWDLASSSISNCLYATDNACCKLFRINLASYDVTSSSVKGNPMGLSVTSTNKVLVACYSVHKLQEYNTDGKKMVTELNLKPAGITYPIRAVELSNRNYLVAYGTTKILQGIREITKTGHPVSSYTCPELEVPCRAIAISKQGTVLIFNSKQRRYVVVNRILTEASAMPMPAIDGDIPDPHSLSHDEGHAELYIGERQGRRLLVFGNVHW